MHLEYDVAVTSAMDADTEWYGVQPKGFGGAMAGLGFCSLQSPFGFMSRPLDASFAADGTPSGCLLFKAEQGVSGDLAWLGNDPRHVDKCPPMSKGSSAQWCATGAFQLFDYDTETATLYVPIDGGASAHKIMVGKDGADKATIDILHSSGACITMTDTEVLIRHTGNGFVQIKGNDVIINGTAKIVSGLDVGGGASIPFALATPLALYLEALEGVISALAAATTPPTTPAIETLMQALAPLRAAIAAQFSKGL